MQILIAIEALSENTKLVELVAKYLQFVPNSEVTVLYVTEEHPIRVLGTSPHQHYVMSDVELRYVNDLEDTVRHVFHEWSNHVHFRHEIGQPEMVIPSVATELNADYVVIGKPQNSVHHVDSWGPVARAVIDRSNRPVLIAN